MAFHAAEEILKQLGPGRVLHVGCTDARLLQELLKRGADACAVSMGIQRWNGDTSHLGQRIHHDGLDSMPFEGPFDTVVVDGNLMLETTDRTALLGALRHKARRALVLWTSGSHAQLMMNTDLAQREHWDNAAIAAGYRRHPRELTIAGYIQRDNPQLSEFSYYEPIDDITLAKWPLQKILETRDLHMDMSRETGCRADAHLIRYSLAAEWIRPGDTVLDCACGLGYGSATLAAGSRGARFIGVDIDTKAVTYARDNFASRYPIEYHQHSAEELSFLDDDSVDMVVSFETIEHLEDYNRFLAEIARVLKPDGRLIASVPNLWVDETGNDPNPHHFHAFDYAKFRNLIEQHFLLEARYAQAAPGGFKLCESPRQLDKLPLDAQGADTEWLLLVASSDPHNKATVAYTHPEFDHATMGDASWVTDFAGHYDNPWLYRAMVQMGQRISEPERLAALSMDVLQQASPSSADFGAALTVTGYHVLTKQLTVQYMEVLTLINEYCALDTGNPHVIRWQISAAYLGGRLCMEMGERDSALAYFDGVAGADPADFSPLLATKTVGAHFWRGVIQLVDGNESGARDAFSQGISAARRALHEPDANAIGNPDSPNTFGFTELAEVADMANQCAIALHYLPKFTSSPGAFWQAVDLKRFGLASWALDLTRENEQLRQQIQSRVQRPGISQTPANITTSTITSQKTTRARAPFEVDSQLWMRDESLSPLQGILADRNTEIKVVSFDFFDTLVARVSAEPVQVFIEVGRRLLQTGLLRPPYSAEEFRHLRENAELRARQCSKGRNNIGEITLQEIYQQLSSVVSDIDACCAVEVDVEKDWCYINPAMASLLQHVKSIGCRVAVLSDTYFSAGQLRDILSHNGFPAAPIDILLTSSDTGMAKWDGSLFVHAMPKFNTSAKTVLHIGDNEISDAARPASMGIRVCHYYRKTPYIADVLKRERRLSENWDQSSAALDSARVMAQRLNHHGYQDSAYYKHGTFLLGPVLAGYADWCVQQFKKTGVTHVLALMREGLLLTELITKAAAAAGITLQVVPFYTSRQASTLAALGVATPGNLISRMQRRTAPKIREVLASFGLQDNEMITEAGLVDEQLSRKNQQSVLRFLTQPQVKSLIEQRSAQRRKELLSYMLPLIGEHTNVGLVDLGWGGTIQANLGQALQLDGHDRHLVGCYLATGTRACNVVLNGMDVRAYLGNLGTGQNLLGPVFRSPEIIEQAVNACVGSTLGYRIQEDGSAVAVLEDYRATPEERTHREHLQAGILAFQELWLKIRGERWPTPWIAQSDSEQERTTIDCYAKAIIGRLIAYPTQDEARDLGGLSHDDNFGSDSWRPICDHSDAQLLDNEGIGSLYRDGQIYWPQGVAAISSPDTIRKLSEGWANPAALGSLGSRPTLFGQPVRKSQDELDLIQAVVNNTRPEQIVVYGWSTQGDRLWLQQLIASGPRSMTGNRLQPALVHVHANAPESPIQLIDPALVCDITGAPGDEATLQAVTRQLSPYRNTLVIIDTAATEDGLAAILELITARLGDGSLVVLGHGTGDKPMKPNVQNTRSTCRGWLKYKGSRGHVKETWQSTWPPAGKQYFTVLEKNRSHDRWVEQHALQEADAQVLAERTLNWTHQPVIHLVMPLMDGEQTRLADTIDSLGTQLYGQWRLSVVSELPCPDSIFEELDILEWIQTGEQQTLNDVIDALINRTDADWLAFIGPGDCFAQHALFSCADEANRNPDWQFIYCDEDRVNASGQHSHPLFKPDLNLELLRSSPYIGNLCFVNLETLKQMGGSTTIDHWTNYDLALRILDDKGPGAIGHVADILFYRCAETAELPLLETDAATGKAVLEGHLQRNGIDASVEEALVAATFNVHYRHPQQPLVSIIIPTRDRLDFLQPCVQSILETTSWPNYEVLIVDNNSCEQSTLRYLETIQQDSRVRVIQYQQEFNYAAINNMAATQAAGDYLLLLNNDTVVLQNEWLDRMMEHIMRGGIGIVGARLIYADETVQHGGVVLGMGANGVAEHPGLGQSMYDPGYLGRAQLTQNVSAVTGACLLISKALYQQVDGMDDTHLKVLYNDIDLCLKVGESGRSIVWTPHATLLHHGSVSVGTQLPESQRKQATAEVATMLDRWLPALTRDPAYNRNLSLAHLDCRPETELHCSWDTAVHDRTRVLGMSYGSSGSGRYRVQEPLVKMHEEAVMQCSLVPNFKDRIRVPSVAELARMAPDTLLLHNTVSDIHMEILDQYKRFNDVFMVFGQDDLMFELPQKNPFRDKVFKDMKSRLRKCIALCDRLVVTTDGLADAYNGMANDIQIIPNYLDRSAWDNLVSLRRQGRKPRVGWAGAQQHRGDIEILLDVVKETAQDVDWVFFGMCLDEMMPYIAEFHHPVDFELYPQKLASLNLDIAVAPLEFNRFNECKSNLKLVEYGALGLPVLCTDIGAYHDTPVHHVTNNTKAWVNAIREYTHDLDAAYRSGDELQRWVQMHHMLQDHLQDWKNLLEPGQQSENNALQQDDQKAGATS